MSQPWPSPALVSNEQQSGKEKYFTVSGRDWVFPFMEIVMKVILVSVCEKSLGVLLSLAALILSTDTHFQQFAVFLCSHSFL